MLNASTWTSNWRFPPERYDSGGNYTQTFDVENRLVEVTVTGGDTVTRFEYDANGLRTRTTVEPADASLSSW
jgi:hypothetical protein